MKCVGVKEPFDYSPLVGDRHGTASSEEFTDPEVDVDRIMGAFQPDPIYDLGSQMVIRIRKAGLRP